MNICAHYDRCLNMVVVNVHFGVINNFIFITFNLFLTYHQTTNILLLLQFPKIINNESSMCWDNNVLHIYSRAHILNGLLRTLGAIELQVIEIDESFFKLCTV